MAEINQIQLPNETIYDIEDATAREAIDNAVTMTFATVATSGSYNDLINKPTIPTVPVTDVTVGGNSVVSSGTAVIPAIPAAVEANPTVPSGTTPTSLSGLKIGSGYYDIDAGGGTVTDVTVDGTSVVNANGVASITTSTVSELSIDSTPTANSTNLVTSGGVKTALDAKQATLVSGTNIKTINNESILGDGNITITGGSGGVTDVKLSDGSSIVTSGIANLPFPHITYADDGKILVADSGHWSAVDNPPEVYTFYAEYAMLGNWNLYHTTGLYDAIVNKIPVVLIVTTPGGNNAQLSLIYDSYSFYDEDADTYKDGIFFASSPLYDSNNGQIEIVYAILEPGEESESESGGWESISVYDIDSWFITPGGSGGVTDVTVGGTSVVSNGTAAVPAIPTVPTISTDISADANSDVKTASPKAVKTYVDSHSGGITGVVLPDGTNLVSNGIATIPNELPSVSSSDNGKVLMVVSGVWAAATLTTQTYYTGQSTPSSSLGNNGDLYLQIDE